jgi:hypothetical protein
MLLQEMITCRTYTSSSASISIEHRVIRGAAAGGGGGGGDGDII